MLSKILQQRWLFKLQIIIWFGVSSWLFFTPTVKLPDTVLSWNDKIGHALVFFLGTCMAYFSFLKPNYRLIISFFALYGLIVEFVQFLLPKDFHRGFDLLDFVADALGVLLAAVVLKKWFFEVV